MTAAMAVDIAPVLGHLSPALHRALGEPALAELATFERTRKLGSALVSFVQLCSQHQRLAIAIDDVHRADGASLGVFGKLSLLAGEHSFLLVISCESGMLCQPPPALAQLLQGRNLIELGALAPEDTHELLASLFGAAPGLDEAASWLHELSLGSPQTCMQYAQYLVEHDIARYEGGQWTLPPRLREAGLPATLGVMFEERVRALSDDARALALGLALARDESRSAWQPENHVHIEDFPKLIDGADSARTFSALDELVRAGMVQQRDSYYVLGQRAMVDALLRLTDTETARRTHRRLGELFEQGSYGGRLLGMRQLQRAGDGARACELVIAFIDRLANVQTDWGAMRLSVTAEVCMDALAQWRVQGGSVRDGIRLRRMLLMVCAVYDWTMAELGDEQIAQLRADGGLLHFDATDPDAPVLQRLIECLKRAQTEYDHKSEHERGLAPGDAIRELAACMMPLTGALVHSHDLTRTRAATAVIQPLRALSPVVELITQYCEQAVKRVSGQDIGDGLLAGAERLLEASELPDMLRRGGAAVNLHMQAVEDARRGRRRALVLMDRLVAAGTGDDMFLVLHGRWLGHAFRGEAALAQRFRKQTEVITEDDIWRRKSFVFVEAQLHALTGDLQSLTRVCDEIAELERRFVGWRPWLGFARGSLHRLRGELDQAESVLRAALTDAPAGEHRAWVMLAPAHAEVLLLRGDAASAVREADAALAAVQALGLDASAEVGALRVRALAESRQARHDAASASIGRALQCARQLRCDGLPLATLYEAQARIAIAAGVSEECVGALTRLRAILEHADAPALINAYEALREESTRSSRCPDCRACCRTRVPRRRSPRPCSRRSARASARSTSAMSARSRRSSCCSRAVVPSAGLCSCSMPAGCLLPPRSGARSQRKSCWRLRKSASMPSWAQHTPRRSPSPIWRSPRPPPRASKKMRARCRSCWRTATSAIRCCWAWRWLRRARRACVHHVGNWCRRSVAA
jgi:tetratricopeptide (TPR) repeat protein